MKAAQPGASGTAVVITWTDNAPIVANPPNFNSETGFTVRRATSASGPWTTLTTTAQASSGTGLTVTYNDTTTQKKKTYYYQVIATNRMGESAPAISNSITTK